MPLPMPESPEQQAAAIAAMTGQMPPGAPQGQPQAMPPGLPQQTPQQPPDAPPTPMEQATQSGAPMNEGDRMREDPKTFKVKFGDDDERELTEGQITGTFSRYADLNYKHAQLKPFYDMGEALMSRVPPGTNPAQVAGALITALTKDPQMGRRDGPPQAPPGGPTASNDDISTALESWEKENASTLPPGYREMLGQLGQYGQALGNMQTMMQQLLSRTAGVADAARASAQDSQQVMAQAREQQIDNNIAEAMRALEMPPERARDMLSHAYSMGYTRADFLDPMVTRKLATTFRNALMAPEAERLKGIHERRQAYTGTMTGAPGNQGMQGPQQAAPGMEALDGIVDFAMRRAGKA